MKVFLAVTSFRDTYGGPAVSVSNLATALADAGVEVGLWAPDGSALARAGTVLSSAVQRLDGAAGRALETFGRPDILHDNGIWMRHNHQLSVFANRWRIRRIVTVHGMLEPWAINNKKWKKTFAWQVYQRRDLASATRHHATADAEANTLRRYDLGVPICVVPNGIEIPDSDPGREFFDASVQATTSQRTALFLGRIHPVKGLPMLIEAWARVRPNGWVLQIAGPDDSGHQRQINNQVRAAGLGEIVSFIGPVSAEQKKCIFHNAELLVLPSHTENFGMVVGEALAHGLPVLTTKGTPWALLRDNRCGWWVDATVNDIAEGLDLATRCDAGTLRQMGKRGRILVQERFAWESVARRFISVYEEMLS